MTYKEYRSILNWELFRGKKTNIINQFRIKHLRPNTNCMLLARKMWYFQSKNGAIWETLAKLYHNRIMHKFGCWIGSEAIVDKGFYIAHPVGIVIGFCNIGQNFTIYQNCTIGTRHVGEGAQGIGPRIGENVKLFAGSAILGDISVCHDVSIGANSLVIKDIEQPGTYVGSPVHRIEKNDAD